MKKLVLLVLDLWCYARWLIIKFVAVLLTIANHLFHIPKNHERRTIWFGNKIFQRRWPYSLYDSFEDYDRTYPVYLKPYFELLHSDIWLLRKDILDLGCGLGGFSREIAKLGARSVVSLEYQPDKAKYAQANGVPGMAVVNASASALPFKKDSFDTVISNTVFEHLPDIRSALSEIRRVLRSEGRALIGFNFYCHRGGHHLFPYIHFPWATWVISEKAACEYWSERLQIDQKSGRMRFYPQMSVIEMLDQGNEISLNKIAYDEFEAEVTNVGFDIERRIPTEIVAQLWPGLVRVLPISHFLTGTVFYSLRRRYD